MDPTYQFNQALIQRPIQVGVRLPLRVSEGCVRSTMESKAFLRFVSPFVFHLLGAQLTVLWLVVLLLAVAVVFIFLQNKRRRRVTKPNGNAGPKEQEDMEAHQQTTTTTNDDETLNSSSRSFSYGAATVIPVFSAITAFGLSVYPHASCEFVGLSEDDSGGLLSIGLWSVAYPYNRASDFGGEGNCYSSFPLNFDPDAALTLARVSAIAATVVGGACMLILLYFSVVAEQQASRLRSSLMVQWLAVSFCVAALFQGLSLSALGTDYCTASTSCTVDFGAVSTMTALLYWLVAAMGVFLLPLKEA
jgi:hypothetical protein